MTQTLFVHADNFFYIASVAVALIGAELCVALAYFTLILRDMKRVSSRVGHEAELLLKDVGGLRNYLKDIIQRLQSLIGLRDPS